MMESHQQPRNSVTLLYTIEEASGLASISRIPTGEQSEAEVTWHEETVVDTFETVNIHTWTSGRLCQCPKRVLGSSAISMKHWSPWNGCAHLNIAYLLRAASVPHIPSFCSVLLWETIVFFILCCSDCHYNCLLIHFLIICIFLGNPLLLPIVLYIYVWSLLIDFQEKFVYIR